MSSSMSSGRNGRSPVVSEERSPASQRQQQSPSTPMEILAQEFPSLTQIERFNFLDIYGDTNKGGEMVLNQHCRDLLNDYIRFRELYQLDSPEQIAAAAKGDDYDDWERAWQEAFRMQANGATVEDMFPSTANQGYDVGGGRGAQGTNPAATTDASAPQLRSDIPAQYMFTYCDQGTNKPCTTRNGDWICHMMPALIDAQTNRAELHALAITLYLSRKICRTSDQRCTILMDGRPQPEWPNPTPRDLLSLVQIVARRMGSVFPNRLQRIIVFPVPTFALVVWKVIQRVLPAKVAAKVVLISGSDKLTAPLPMDQLKQHVELTLLDRMFSQRKHAVQIHDWLLLLS